MSALSQLFSIFGPSLAIHSDRGRVFESVEFKSFLDRWNACKTRTTPYIPAGNGRLLPEAERNNLEDNETSTGATS